jgi:UDP-N-acetylglucosamine 2-epimerase (non-hydrolysing)
MTARLMDGFEALLAGHGPFDAVLAQGDTTTVMTAALAAFYHRIPFGHVEAGLRTLDLDNPFPEEANRQIASRLSCWHFAPTEGARANLLREGIDPASITVTGNTVIDALLAAAPSAHDIGVPLIPELRLVLLTAHRRENFGAPLARVMAAVRALTDRHRDIQILYPVHPNPEVLRAAALLEGHPRIVLCPPLDYLPFIAAMKRATLVLTDSGGVQEEAPALGKPVLVLRETTERPEAVAAGVVRQVGTDTDAIFTEASLLLSDGAAYRAMARGVSPYGDGKAAPRIVAALARSLTGEDLGNLALPQFAVA